MNTAGIIGSIVAVLVVGAGIAYVVLSPAPQGEGSVATTTPETTDHMTGNATLRTLTTMRGTVSCTVSSSASGAVSDGTLYLAEGKMRADINTRGGSTAAAPWHVIHKDGTTYTWSDLSSQGGKISEASVLVRENASASSTASGRRSAEYDYSCTPWTADAAKFELPTSVTFTEIVPGGATGSASTGAGGYPAGTLTHPKY